MHPAPRISIWPHERDDVLGFEAEPTLVECMSKHLGSGIAAMVLVFLCAVPAAALPTPPNPWGADLWSEWTRSTIWRVDAKSRCVIEIGDDAWTAEGVPMGKAGGPKMCDEAGTSLDDLLAGITNLFDDDGIEFFDPGMASSAASTATGKAPKFGPANPGSRIVRTTRGPGLGGGSTFLPTRSGGSGDDEDDPDDPRSIGPDPTVLPTPLPASLWMLLAGTGAIWLLRRSRGTHARPACTGA